jgi:hypothetical protein
MEQFRIDYTYILGQLKSQKNEVSADELGELLVDHWCEQYRLMTPSKTNILQFTVDGFEYLFDFTSELVSRNVIDPKQQVEDRVVAVFGCSKEAIKKRDINRQRGFLGPTKRVFGSNYDKGHFIGHSLGGGLDINLFPQRRVINRGWSARGKVFRSMEQYCALNPGTFCFSRPIYRDLTWRPSELEYGILKKNGELWVERFDN